MLAVAHKILPACWVLSIAVLIVGCNEAGNNRDGGSAGKPASGTTTNSTANEPPPDRPTQVNKSDLDALEIPKSVRPFSLATVDKRSKSGARKLNAAGLKLYSSKDYRGAIVRYTAALRLDPSNLLARYNLSCAYNLVGEPEKGLALLDEFRRADCPGCRGRLTRAAEDADWHSMWAHPLFVEIVGVSVNASDDTSDKARQDKLPFWERDSPCPSGTKLVGSKNVEMYCVRGNLRLGPYVRWHKGGKMLSETGDYDGGQRIGSWKFFHPSGSLRETGEFKSGKKVGAWSEWHADGTQAADGRYSDGQKHGRWTWFDSDGKIIKQADFTRGVRGQWIISPTAPSKTEPKPPT